MIFSILFQTLALVFFIIERYDDNDTFKILNHLSTALLYYSVLPILFKFNLYIVFFFNLILAVYFSLYVYKYEADGNNLILPEYEDFVINKGPICAPVLELIYQMFRRRLYCFR
jgi:hypothetical protein